MRLKETEMVKLLPAWMQEDSSNQGLAAGCDIVSRDAYARLKLLSRWDKIDQLSEAELDEMAWELNIQWYDSTAPIAAKRAVIRNSDRVYSKLGTPYAVEQIVADYFGTGEVREWYQSPFRAHRQPSPSARRRPGPCSASPTRIVTGICTRPSTTLPKSSTRRRTSSPVRGSTRSSTEEVEQYGRKEAPAQAEKKIEASKKLAYWAAIVASLSAATSYLLSAFGRDPVSEVTGTIFTACVGYLITYAGKSLGEKISRNRHRLDADGNPLPDPSGDTLNNEEAKG